MGKADLHIHTCYSFDGTSTVSAVLEQAAHHTDLNVIAITDHDENEGALRAVEMAPAYGIEVIPGVEVSTAEGHLLALFVYRPILRGLSLVETILKVAQQGGICVVPHPMARGENGIKAPVIARALHNSEVARTLVGLEVYNAGLFYWTSNQTASQLAFSLRLSRIGSSDSHMLWTIGAASTYFRGTTAHDLRKALLEHSTGVTGEQQPQPLRYFASWGKSQVLRKLGWVISVRYPTSPFFLKRLNRTSN